MFSSSWRITILAVFLFSSYSQSQTQEASQQPIATDGVKQVAIIGMYCFLIAYDQLFFPYSLIKLYF